MRSKNWSPYICGIVIGLLQIPVFFIGGSIGTSGATANVVCSLTNILGGDAVSTCFTVPKSWWQLGFIIGIVLGAYVSKMLSRNYRKPISSVWRDILPNYSVKKRLLYAFIGGFLVLFGARLADGCTSGNGISGIALMSVGSFIVIFFMFIAGILMASLLYKKVRHG